MTEQIQKIIQDITSCTKCQYSIDACKDFDGCISIVSGPKVGLFRFKVGFLEHTADAETLEWCIAEERKTWYEEIQGAPQ